MSFCDLHSRKLKQRIPYGYYRRWLEAESLKLGTEIYPHIMKIVNNVKEMLKVLGMKLTGFLSEKHPLLGICIVFTTTVSNQNKSLSAFT